MPSSSTGNVKLLQFFARLFHKRYQVLVLIGTGVSQDQSWCVQAVTAHHAADGIGDQLLHGVLAEAGPLLLFGELATVAVGRVHREGDLLDGDVGGELFRQAVGVDEEAVVLLFETLHLGDGALVLGDPGGVAGFEGGRGLGGGRQEGEGLEVPGAFVGVPVGADSPGNSSDLHRSALAAPTGNLAEHFRRSKLSVGFN